MALTRIQKIFVAGLCMFFYSVLFQSAILPSVIKSQVKKKVALKKGWRMRGLWGKLPFPLILHFYIFNVTNPDEIAEGKKPIVQEVGPFAYDEWHEKTNQIDHDEDDTVSYTTRNTYYFNPTLSGGLTGEEEVIVPHLFPLATINTIMRSNPHALPIVGKALESVLRKPTSLFIKVKVRDILFDGIIIDCNVKDFAGSAMCKEIADNYEKFRLKLVGENLYSVSIWGPMNATDAKGRLRVYRGLKNIMDVGRVVEYDNKPNVSVWGDNYCDTFNGTDGTIFHPYFDKKGRDDLVAYNPSLCRGLSCYYDAKVKVSGMQLLRYTSDLGVDGDNNPRHKCYCNAPGDCLKKGAFDLYKCVGAPLIVTNPHFYLADPYYISTVDGLKPEKEKHMLTVDLDPFTGAPFVAHTRAQFNMFITKVEKFKLMKKFPDALLPLVWIDETMNLPNEFVQEIKMGAILIKVVKVLMNLMMLGGLGMCGYGGYHLYKSNQQENLSHLKKEVKSKQDDEKAENALQSLSVSNLRSVAMPTNVE